MTELDCDVAILGAGFGGSLMALVLQRIGLRPVLVDRGAHPRFAIGESSTPVADVVLRDLAIRYDLPRLLPLAKYGTWKEAYPEIVCGLKRGFSYFEHRHGEAFTPRADHANELLVAASQDNQSSDTHWLRSDVDSFFAREAVAAGVPYFDRTQVTIDSRGPWQLTCTKTGTGNPETLKISAAFLVDASGDGGVLTRHLGLEDRTAELQTHSRSIFAHFAGVKRWEACVTDWGGGDLLADHPYPCDGAALHQVYPDGWMWQLRFDNDITSVGFMLDTRRCPLDSSLSAQEEWAALLRLYPSIGEQLANATIVAPEGGLRRTGRIQRWIGQGAGPDWALLPHTAGFIDPLNSTGNAHTLCGIERLGRTFERHWKRETFPDELGKYARAVSQETQFIDELISGCYEAMPDFAFFATYSMLYFAMVTSFEHGRSTGTLPPETPYFGADQPERWDVARIVRQRLREALPKGAAGLRAFQIDVAQAIAPYNIAGLCDPSVRNMYRYTAADKG